VIGWWRVGAWAFVVSGVAALGWSAVAPVGDAAPLGAAARLAPTPTLSARAVPDSLVRRIVSRDPFRPDRRPSPVAYDPTRAGQPIVAPPPKPTLVLVGVVQGTDPTAVIEGLPGIEGPRVVRVGDVIGGLTVRAIATDGVRVVGLDTVWVLKVRKP
jgi:hypothetical protein